MNTQQASEVLLPNSVACIKHLSFMVCDCTRDCSRLVQSPVPWSIKQCTALTRALYSLGQLQDAVWEDAGLHKVLPALSTVAHTH